MILNNDFKYRGELGKTLRLDEYSSVEQPCYEKKGIFALSNATKKVRYG